MTLMKMTLIEKTLITGCNYSPIYLICRIIIRVSKLRDDCIPMFYILLITSKVRITDKVNKESEK